MEGNTNLYYYIGMYSKNVGDYFFINVMMELISKAWIFGDERI